MGLRKMYETFSWTMTQPEFEHYCNPSSLACQLLLAHFTALQLIMSPVTRAEQRFKEAEVGKQLNDNGKTVAWLVGIHRRVPNEYKKYFAWTKWVQDQVLSGFLFSGRVCHDKEPDALNDVMGSWNDDWRTILGGQV
jgi:hypothetical protein